MKTLFLVTLAAASLGVTAGAQTLTLIDPVTNNGSFETSPAAKTDFTPTTSNANAIPFWGSTAGTNDTGVDTGVPAQSNNDIAQQGTKGAFERFGTGIFNLVTTRPIVAGDTFTLTFYARSTSGTAPLGSFTQSLTVTLYSQAATTTGSTYSYTPTATLAMLTPTINNAAFVNQTAYTLTYKASAADAGLDIGLTVQNTSANYNGVDNFVLTVVPEPSTDAMVFAGVAGLVFVLRARRSAA